MDLAEDSMTIPSRGRLLARVAIGAAVAALVVTLAWWLRSAGSQDTAPKRQVARIAILPDTPPPPPPPPREDKPPPRDEARPAPRDESPKPADAPKAANEPLKMEGAAGDGPSAFAAGTVRNEYQGGPPSIGTASAAGGGGSVADRARDRFYAGSARQLLRDEIERHLRGDAQQATAEFTVWVDRDGSIRRTELQPTGDGRLDAALDAALDETRRTLKLPAPPVALQPMRFRLTVRPQG